MRRLLPTTLAWLALLALASPAAAVILQGTLTPVPMGDGSNYACLVSATPVNAQDGTDVVLTGTITGALSADATYEVQVGLVPKAAYKELQAGTISTLWNEGMWAAAWTDALGQVSVAAEDYALQANAPARGGLANDGAVFFKLTLKPKLFAFGGEATLKADGHASNLGKPALRYGRRAASDPLRNEDYSAAYLVARVRSEAALDAVSVTAKAKPLPYGLRVTKIKTFDPTMTPTTTFQPGEAVVVQTTYLVMSADPAKQYQVKGTLRLLGLAQPVSKSQVAGTYTDTRTFVVPTGTAAGTYNIKATLKLLFGGLLLYTEEVVKPITVQ